jgi:hypothetical protein
MRAAQRYHKTGFQNPKYTIGTAPFAAPRPLTNLAFAADTGVRRSI